jgi:hypothetical protein
MSGAEAEDRPPLASDLFDIAARPDTMGRAARSFSEVVGLRLSRDNYRWKQPRVCEGDRGVLGSGGPSEDPAFPGERLLRLSSG